MKKFISALSLCFFFFTSLATGKIDKDKKSIISILEAHKDRLIEISDNIWEAAEPALLEFKSSKYLWDYAEENGFKVTKGVADIPTAFTAEYGSGKPIIGIMGEFDANPGISQKKQPTKEPLIKGAAGHGCGHNLFGAASLGAAIAIKEMIEAGEIKKIKKKYSDYDKIICAMGAEIGDLTKFKFIEQCDFYILIGRSFQFDEYTYKKFSNTVWEKEKKCLGFFLID